MLEHSLITPFNDDSRIISSRRRFLKQMVGGSLLAISGSSIASAAVRHVYYSNAHHKKSAPHKTHTGHPHKTTAAQRSHHASNPHQQAVTTHSHHSNLSHKVIALHNINTGDNLNLTYFERGRYIEDALQEINYLFRDYHTGAIHPVDPLLLDQLHELKQQLDVNKPFHVISGYRSPFTNAHLRNQSSGVAKHSLHMEGRAIDIRVEGLAIKNIRNAALAMRRGGVGYYPSANFVHLDTGEYRAW